MLRQLRFQLTFLYILVAISLVALTGVGSYSLLRYYFQRETDLALQYKMAAQFREYGLTPPEELIHAEQHWQAINPRQPSPATRTPGKAVSPDSESEDDSEQGERPEPGAQIAGNQEIQQEEDSEENYDGQLASIYVLHLDANGQILNNPSGSQPPFSQDVDASRAAILTGHDLRTSTLTDGTRVRLLTYNLTGPNSPVLLQMGRTLIDQERVLQQYLVGLFLLGLFASLLLGLGSWYLSGRSLGPAQRAWDQQQAFVSNASHELRTPLTLIKASAEVGLRDHPVGEQRELWQDILGEADYMNRLVDDLLLLSRLDTHRLKLVRERVSLAELLHEMAHQAEKLVGEKGIRIEVGNVSGVILADPIRMRQVLLILIDNALRFTPPGGTIRLETAAKRKVQQIIVSDNGSGISPEHLPHLFERFYQANPNGETLTRSNGLGLSIARGLLEAQGGAIRIESQLGVGTRVLLELPAASEVLSG
jgi:signal transduction histidine kinase